MTVQKGQVYLDKDPRRPGRSFRIEAVLLDGRALIKPLTGGTKMTKISLSRFKPWKYELQASSAITPVLATLAPLPKSWAAAAPTPTPVLSGPSLAQECLEVIPGNWKSDWPHVAVLSEGCLGLVVRRFNSNTAFDVKIKLDGLIVDTWSSQHLDLNTVLNHLYSKLEIMRDDFSSIL